MSSESFLSTLKTKGPRLGIFTGLPSLLAAQIVASSGYDFVIIDMEHNPLSAATATATVHTVAAASKGACHPLVRVPAHGVEWIKWGLDSGAAGIVVPMVQSGAEARAVVTRARYPPLGERSFGPVGAPFADVRNVGGVGEYFRKARRVRTGRMGRMGGGSGVGGVEDEVEGEDGVAVFPMIESRRGVENAEAILGTEGVSGAFVGPFDLRCSLGLEGGDGEEELFVGALKAIVAAGKKHGKPLGIMAPSREAFQRDLELGFTFVAYLGDSTLLGMGAKASVKEGREVIGSVKL